MLKRLAGPFRNYFNSRFGAVHNSIVQGQADDRRMLDAALRGIDEASEAISNADENVQQSLALMTRTLDELVRRVDAVIDPSTGHPTGGQTQAELMDKVARALDLVVFDPGQRGELAALTSYDASVANFANAHDGWAAQAGLWFNPPLSVEHAAGGVALSQVNERIGELPYVFRQLADLGPGSRVLDVGSTESSAALSLASLGLSVTALDPRPYPLSHPDLTSFQGGIAEFTPEAPFDAVVLLSSIEHFGVGAYDLPVEEDADLKAMDKIRTLTRPGGRLVLTTPFGDTATTHLGRTYSHERLSHLLRGWTVDDQSYLVRESSTVWRWAEDVGGGHGDVVVLISARRAGDAA